MQCNKKDAALDDTVMMRCLQRQNLACMLFSVEAMMFCLVRLKSEGLPNLTKPC